MLKKIKYKIISSEIYCKFFNRDVHVKICLMKLVIEHFKKNPDKHVQQLFVDSFKMLGIRHDNSSKMFVGKLILRQNNNFYELQKELPTPVYVVTSIGINGKENKVPFKELNLN